MARSKHLPDAEVWGSVGRSASLGDGGPRAAEEIADIIQELIFTQRLTEGARLPSERDLAQMLSTSRPTVSQAIRILVVRGLVESRRGSGAYVSRRPEASLATSMHLLLNLNQDSAQKLNELRLWLELTGIARAIEFATEEEIARGRRALEQLRRSAGDTAAWMSADTLFHSTLVRASDNPFLASIFESVHSTLIGYEYGDWVERGTTPRWLEREAADALMAVHEPILDALIERDVDAGRAAVLRHHEEMAEHLRAMRSAAAG